jgi:TRAP-type mannitol/chloroaromatic compound transport system substrate-binding protein
MKKTLAISAACLSLLVYAGTAQAEVWQLQSTYTGTTPQLGTTGKFIAKRITDLTDGEITVEFQEPGGIVPALETFDAVSSGAVEAGWAVAGYWAGKVPALQIFSTVPFGPGPGEFLAWMRHGGGKQLHEEIYHKHNIHPLSCGIVSPEASGWFRKEIKNVEDFRGLKMRFFGLGARVMEKLGVSTQLLAGGDIFPALELGTIDATEFSTPAIDLGLGFHQVANHYYFPGWHQQSTLVDLIINRDVWEGLDESTRQKIEAACEAAITDSLAEGEAIQAKALEEIAAKGVQIHEWSPEILATIEGAWEQVVAEQAAADPEFKRVWDSLSGFRKNYARWKDIGYLGQ